jgi:hypothetical protein
VTDSNIELVVARLDDITDDVKYIRGKVDENSKKISGLEVASAKHQGERGALKWAITLGVPAFISLVVAGAAIALGR